jgi:hypothetical protein
MNILNIAEKTTIEDVRTWNMATVDGFRLTKSSSFEPGAQGLALAKLAAHQKGRLEVQCAFAESQTASEFESSLLGGPFGISLVRHASKVTFGPSNEPITKGFDEALALYYREKGGLLGKGQSCALVCVDPAHSIPPKLKAYARHEDRGFPVDPSGFRALLASMASLLGFRNFLSSATEASLSGFLFECFVNSQEHGQSTVNSVARKGIRTLLIEKIVVSSTTRHDRLSKELQEYIARSSEATKSKLGLGLVCITIADQGDGIQGTLPADSLEETPVARFARAFLPGVTRKPHGEIKRGLGLSHALSAAHKMRARIEIHSSGVHYVQDFSFEESEYPALDAKAIVPDESCLGSGTAVSIWVPEFEAGLDQPDLFDRKSLLPVA